MCDYFFIGREYSYSGRWAVDEFDYSNRFHSYLSDKRSNGFGGWPKCICLDDQQWELSAKSGYRSDCSKCQSNRFKCGY
jgi:hypothetical protein